MLSFIGLPTNLKNCLWILLVACFCSCSVAMADDSHEAPKKFAVVDGEVITLKEFQSALAVGIRKRFYHGKIPKAKLEAFKKEVSQTMIDRILLVKEAKRQQIKPDSAEVAKQIGLYEKRYKDRPFWQQHKKSVLPGLRAALEEESILQRLKEKTKAVPLPTDEQAKVFYRKNKDLFTTPEKVRVSVILLKVSPGSPANVWQAADDEANDLIKRVKNGADFAELARIHSGDESASKGGDMGYVHKGMLAKPAQLAIDNLQPGDVSEPVMLLQGVGIFQMHEKQAPQLNSFEQVAKRAKQLLQRKKAKLAWSDLLEDLRSRAKIEINTAALTTIKKS